MTSPRPCPMRQTTYFSSGSSRSPLTSQHVGRTIPIGTVASRIVQLQNLAGSSSRKSPPQIPRQREDSRTGFGRRTSSRFGKPASRTSRPEEQAQVEIEHSFRGLYTSRANHLEEHAIVGHTTKWDRTAGLQAQLQPKGLGTRVQYEATSPWAILPKSKSYKNLRHEAHRYSEHELNELKPSKSVAEFHTPLEKKCTPAPAAQTKVEQAESKPAAKLIERSAVGKEELCSPHGRISKQKEGSVSVETTSTIRRQSVKDLYEQYGIQRPAGLVSSENIAYDLEETSRQAQAPLICHVCSWVNGVDEKCWRCGHRFCGHCNGWSIGKDIAERISSEVHQHRHAEIQTQVSVPSKPQPSHPKVFIYGSPSQQQSRPLSSQRVMGKEWTSPEDESPVARNTVTKPQGFPILRIEQPSPRHESQDSVTSNGNGPSPWVDPVHPSLTQKPRGVVKDSPFLLADVGSPACSISLLPIALRVSNHHHHRRSHRYDRNPEEPSQGNGQVRSTSSENPPLDEQGECDSSGCRATHPGHSPYRHSISCSRKRQRHPKETDSGYVAGTSHLEEHDVSSEPRQLHGSGKGRELKSCGIHELVHREHAAVQKEHEAVHREHKAVHRELVHNSEPRSPCQAEYVEYHGHPRTGQVHHSTPIAAEILECQHCLNDCQCEACQSTYHNVRCRVHEDHHAPRTQISSSDRTSSPSVALVSSPKIIAPQISDQELETSIPTVIMPTPRRKMTSPPWMIDNHITYTESEGISRRSTQATPMQKSNQRTPCSSKDKPQKRALNLELPSPFREHRTPLPPRKNDELSPDPGRSETEDSTIEEKTSLARHESCTYRSETPKKTRGSISPLYRVFSPTMPTSKVSITNKPETASRRLSAFFKLQEQSATTVRLLNHRLLDHQEELRKIEKMCDAGLEAAHEIKGKDGNLNSKCKSKSPAKVALPAHRDVPMAKNPVKDREPVKKAISPRLQHRLEPPVTSKSPLKQTEGKEHAQDYEGHSHGDGEQLIDCSRKEVSVDSIAPQRSAVKQDAQFNDDADNEEFGDAGIIGISIVIHLEGKEDLVFRTDLSAGV